MKNYSNLGYFTKSLVHGKKKELHCSLKNNNIKYGCLDEEVGTVLKN